MLIFGLALLMLSHAYVGLGFGVARLESFIINTLSYTYPLFTYVNVLLFMKLHPYIPWDIFVMNMLDICFRTRKNIS